MNDERWSLRKSCALAFAMSAICWLLLALLARAAFAHPADDPCPPGVTVSFGCQVLAPNLGLNNPTFYAVHKSYWHCRRTLEGTLLEYSRCLGAVNFRRWQLGLAPLAGEPGCLTYHEIIPATPLVEKPGDLVNANAQLQACQANQCWQYVNACWAYLAAID